MEEFGIGCTIIKGDLEIKIFDDIFNLTDELQKYLGNVETILGNIKIHRFVRLALNEKSFSSFDLLLAGRHQLPH